MAATLPGYESTSIYGLFAPAGTPRAIIQKLNAETVRYLKRAEVHERRVDDIRIVARRLAPTRRQALYARADRVRALQARPSLALR